MASFGRALWLRGVLTVALVAGLVAGLPPVPVVAAEPDFVEPSVPVTPVPSVVGEGERPPDFVRPEVSWPSAASAVIDVSAVSGEARAAAAGSVTVGGLPVRVSVVSSGPAADFLTSRGRVADPSSVTTGVSQVSVSVLDRDLAQRLGVGVVLTATVLTAWRGRPRWVSRSAMRVSRSVMARTTVGGCGWCSCRTVR